MDIALSLLAGLLLIAVIIAANGYFVAQEFSYMAVDRSRLKAMAAEGDKGAERTLRITERTSFMLSGAQLGITVTGLLVGYVAEPLVGSAIGELLGGAGVPTAVGVAVGTIGVLVLATFTQMLFGELFPKNLAIAKPLSVATRLSASTWVYMRSLGWLIAIFDAASNALLRVLRIEPVHDVEHSANVHDLQRIVSLSRDAGELTPELSLVLDRMLDFPERNVGHALVPRARVDTVSEDTTLGEVLRTMEGGHSRYPVLDDQGDVVGVVHLIDVLQALEDGVDTVVGDGSSGRPPHGRPEDRSVREVSRPATVVPTLMLLPEALTTMTEAGDQIACAIDEYGGLAGIVTVEDLAEEVVGELTDEHDEDVTPHLTSAGERAWTVRGDAPLDEVEREIGVMLPRGEYHTVAGLVIAARGALPQPGECVEVELPADPVELAHHEHPPRRSLRATVRDVARYVPTDLELELAEQTTDTLGAS